MIDKGDNFDGTPPGLVVARAIRYSAFVALVVSLATVLVVELLVVRRVSPLAPPAPAPSDLGILTEGEVMVQSGKERSATSGEHDVYYPATFPATPNLSFTDGDAPEIREQRKDGFKYYSPFGSTQFSWRAVGLRPLPDDRTTLRATTKN